MPPSGAKDPKEPSLPRGYMDESVSNKEHDESCQYEDCDDEDCELAGPEHVESDHPECRRDACERGRCEHPEHTDQRTEVAHDQVLRCAAILVLSVFALSAFPWPVALLFFFPLWYLGARLLTDADRPPWEVSTFFVALLTAWAVDYILFRAAIPYGRRFAPAVIVVSIALGYVAWRAGDQSARASKGYANPHRIVLGCLLAAFLIPYVVSPVFGHYLPGFWHWVSTAPSMHLGSDEDTGQ